MQFCRWPNCGYVFKKGERKYNPCPGCGRDPDATHDEEGKPFTYSEAFMKGKKILSSGARL